MLNTPVTNKAIKLPSFELSSGESSGELEVECCLWGQLDRPLVVLMGGISANRWVMDSHQGQGWWQQVVHDKAALNTQDYAFLTFEYQCLRQQHVGVTPVITTTDQAHILRLIQIQLGLPQFHAVIGSSYGGMVSLALATRYPDALKQLICIAAADRNSVKSQALRHIQRQIMTLGCQYGEKGAQQDFIALARALAMVGYRGEVEWEQRFKDIVPGRALSDVSSYLEYHGNQFAQRFAPDRYAQLSQSIDYHQIDATAIQTRTLLVGFTTDQMVPVQLLEQLQSRIPGQCQLHLINSIYGHDGFLLEADALNEIFNTFLSEQPHDYIERNNRRASGY